MAQWVWRRAFKPQSTHTGAGEMPAPRPSLPEAQGWPDTAGQWPWAPAWLRAFVINAQRLPDPARSIRLPVAGGRAGDLGQRPRPPERHLPDRGQKRRDAHPIKGSYQCAQSGPEPVALPGTERELAPVSPPAATEGWGRGPQGDPGLCQAVLTLLSPSSLLNPSRAMQALA